MTSAQVKSLYKTSNNGCLDYPSLLGDECTFVMRGHAFSLDISDYGLRLKASEVISYFNSAVGPIYQDYFLQTYLYGNQIILPDQPISAVYEDLPYLVFILFDQFVRYNIYNINSHNMNTRSIGFMILSSYYHMETRSLLIATNHSIEIYDIEGNYFFKSIFGQLRSLQLVNFHMCCCQITPLRLNTRKPFPCKPSISRSQGLH